MIFRDLIDRRAESDPTGAAIADSTRTYDNSEFADAIRATQAHLVAAGVAPGDVVAVALTNRVEFVTILFAAWRLGATVTPINPASTPTELARQVADSAAVLTVVEDTADPSDASVRVSDVTGPSSGPVPGVYDGPAAPALLIYTSGSTGTPKGVVLGHDNIEAMTSMGIEGLHLTSDDACLLILPLFHVNGIVVSVLCPLRAGARVVVADRFDPRTFFDIVDEHRPTYFSAVPTIITMLTALPDDVSPDTSSLRFVVCGAAPASAELLRAFESRYGTIVLEGYGLSEGTCASTLNPLDGVRKPGTVGLPFPGQEIRIVAADGTVAAEGEPGEVCIRGANVMAGYLGRDEDTARTVVDGWLHTGDVGTLDSDGYLTIVGRTKEMIIRGGENIYPREIEDVLSLDPAVLESAVIGVPDDKWGESVVAFVSSRAGHTVDTERLDALCRDRLSRFKWPTTITVVDALPKNAVGKLDRRALSDF